MNIAMVISAFNNAPKKTNNLNLFTLKLVPTESISKPIKGSFMMSTAFINKSMGTRQLKGRFNTLDRYRK